MLENSYWQDTLKRRLSRRRALISSASMASAAAFLAACGGGGDGSGSVDSTTLLTQAVDTTTSAKFGGIIKERIHADVPSLDVNASVSALNSVSSHVMSSLVRVKAGVLEGAKNELEPDIAESWETSADGLSITLKIRQNVKWHNTAPINGRTLDVDDVVASWQRFAAKGASRSAIVAAVTPDAPVESITAVDRSTVVMKLSEPLVYALNLFTPTTTGGFLIVPKEIDGAFDPRKDMIGTGPYVLTKYEPSRGFTFQRNADYWEKDYAYADGVDMPIIPEYASTLAQFKAGNLYSFSSYGSSPKITPEDVLPTKREQPRINVYQADLITPGGGTRILNFGWLPDSNAKDGKSIFFDERVRQAMSMAWDRDLYMDTFFNREQFEAQGLPITININSALLGNVSGFWLDPRDEKNFGPNAKYFKHDVAEVKKLLSAAGFPDGFGTISNYVTTSELPTAKQAEILDGMMAEAGIRSTVNAVDYSSVYVPKFRNGSGQYEGYVYKSAAGGATGGDVMGILANEYWSKAGVTFHGFSASGKNDKSGDPQVDSIIEKGRIERDLDKRRQLGFELQRYLAGKMYAIQSPGVGSPFDMAWPALANFSVFRGPGNRQNYKIWIDQTKAPFTA